MHIFVSVKRTWDQKLSSGWMMSCQLSPALPGLMSLTFMTTHLFQFPFAVTEQYSSSLLCRDGRHSIPDSDLDGIRPPCLGQGSVSELAPSRSMLLHVPALCRHNITVDAKMLMLCRSVVPSAPASAFVVESIGAFTVDTSSVHTRRWWRDSHRCLGELQQ